MSVQERGSVNWEHLCAAHGVECTAQGTTLTPQASLRNHFLPLPASRWPFAPFTVQLWLARSVSAMGTTWQCFDSQPPCPRLLPAPGLHWAQNTRCGGVHLLCTHKPLAKAQKIIHGWLWTMASRNNGWISLFPFLSWRGPREAASLRHKEDNPICTRCCFSLSSSLPYCPSILENSSRINNLGTLVCLPNAWTC